MSKCEQDRGIKKNPNVLSVSELLWQKGYKLGASIGEGSYCKVRSAIKMLNRGHCKRMACKMINKKKASSDFVTRFLPRELSILSRIHHPHIIQVFDIFESSEHVYIFTNLCEKGDLLEFVKRGGPLPEHKARSFFRQIVSAIFYLHSRDISHRDVKCENIFITRNEDVMLGDFGFARMCRDQQTQSRVLSETYCGSAAYAAPEILQGVPYNPKMYDIWSMGCVLYIMMTGTMPFDDTNVQKMLELQLTRQIETRSFNLRNSVVKLIFHMLEPDITMRATINHIEQSPWLQEQYHYNFYPIPPVKYVVRR